MSDKKFLVDRKGNKALYIEREVCGKVIITGKEADYEYLILYPYPMQNPSFPLLGLLVVVNKYGMFPSKDTDIPYEFVYSPPIELYLSGNYHIIIDKLKTIKILVKEDEDASEKEN